MWQTEEEDEAAGVAVKAVQTGDERVAHDVRRKLVNMVSLHQGISQQPLSEAFQKIRGEGEKQDDDQHHASNHGGDHPHDVSLPPHGVGHEK